MTQQESSQKYRSAGTDEEPDYMAYLMKQISNKEDDQAFLSPPPKQLQKEKSARSSS